jgi:hypothetical protein
MKKYITILSLILLTSGCATFSSSPPCPQPEDTLPKQSTDRLPERTQPVPGEKAKDASDASIKLKNIQEEELDGYAHSKGVVFAKVEVYGVLKADFLNLIIENIKDPSLQYRLFIGKDMGKQFFPWEGQDNNEGHFFIELPAGRYQISSVNIPVGSTMASENLDVTFKVIPGSIAYLGTLKLIGTKEKVRLGGVPVIKPGFEYKAAVINEKDDAVADFYNRFPNFRSEIVENIMRIPEGDKAFP